ncbi:MAG: dUTP diphosphatase [Eggerthellaceae bacterium]|nr:dUTP diphosphatase [Eggerthellaceae bacterium]
MNTVNLTMKILNKNAKIPVQTYDLDAGCDLSSTIDTDLAPFERVIVPTGLAFELPKDYAALILPRSGLASQHGITLPNTPGLIDSGYRGEIKIPLINLDSKNSFHINIGDRIAQMVLIKNTKVDFSQSKDFSESERSGQGFGSSGV